MTPRTATAHRTVTSPLEAPRSAPRLRLSRPEPREPTPSPRRSRHLLRPVTAATSLVVASLLAVVIGNMMLASGQLRLEQLQTKLAATESKYAVKLEKYTVAESPQAAAVLKAREGLVQPDLVLPIPAASLTHRLALPTFSSAPCCALTPRR